MDPAIIGYMRVGYFRIGVQMSKWDNNIILQYEKASLIAFADLVKQFEKSKPKSFADVIKQFENV